MRVLLDNNVHVDLAEDLRVHEVVHARDLGWQRLSNGDLVREANSRFDVLVTIDKNMRHQTSLTGLSLSVLVLNVMNSTLPELKKFIPAALEAIGRREPGCYMLVEAL